jgi:nucleoside-diphosphate-sugar epimerase
VGQGIKPEASHWPRTLELWATFGANTRCRYVPLTTPINPLSLYGAPKKANELMAQAYASLFGLPKTASRFFTVYGPWGRPDMAMWLFTAASVVGQSCDRTGETGRIFEIRDRLAAFPS